MRSSRRTWSFTALALLPCAVSAQEGVQVGPMRVLPTLGVSMQYETNVFRTNQNELDSFLTVVSPGIKIDLGGGATRFVFTYDGDWGRYEKEGAKSNNFTDHAVSAGVNLDLSDRLRADAAVRHQRGHDKRGDGAQQGGLLGPEVDKFRRTGFDVGVQYGAPGARGMLEFSAGHDDLEYRNNRNFTRLRDRTTSKLGGTFGWRVGGRTTALLSVDTAETEYDVQLAGQPGRDSKTRNYQVGVGFDATGRTTGRILVGRNEKDFDDPRVEDYSGFGWSAGVQWKPVTYSVFDFATSRSSVEADDIVTFGAGSFFAVRRDFSVAWSHGWSNRLQTSVDVAFGSNDYRAITDEGRTVRSDDFRAFGASANYQFRRWLGVGLGYKHYERDSGAREFDYSQDVFLLTFEASL